MILLLVAVTCTGCGYGEISPTTYQYAKAIYGIAGRRADSQIEPFEQQLDAAVTEGEIPKHEAQWLRAMADDARHGHWSDAQKAARKMMEDQVRS